MLTLYALSVQLIWLFRLSSAIWKRIKHPEHYPPAFFNTVLRRLWLVCAIAWCLIVGAIASIMPTSSTDDSALPYILVMAVLPLCIGPLLVGIVRYVLRGTVMKPKSTDKPIQAEWADD